MKRDRRFINAYIYKDQLTKLKELADIKGVSYASLIREAIDLYIKKLERKNQIISPLK